MILQKRVSLMVQDTMDQNASSIVVYRISMNSCPYCTLDVRLAMLLHPHVANDRCPGRFSASLAKCALRFLRSLSQTSCGSSLSAVKNFVDPVTSPGNQFS